MKCIWQRNINDRLASSRFCTELATQVSFLAAADSDHVRLQYDCVLEVPQYIDAHAQHTETATVNERNIGE